MGLLLISEAYNQRIMKNMHKWALFVHHKNMLNGVVQRCLLLTVDEKTNWRASLSAEF